MRAILPLVILFLGCGDKDDPAVETDVPTDADTDSDSDTDADADQ